MWHRPVVAFALSLAIALPASAQVSGVYSRAVPPDRAVLERLNLKTEWTAHLPIDSRKDSISHAQTFDDQLFIQSRTGIVVAIDVITGRIQWSVQLGNGNFTTTYPAAVNSQFIYVANVTQLYAFHRYTGAVEFVTDMESTPTGGLAADDSAVYCVLSIRTGNTGSQRVTVYNLPRPIAIADAAKKPLLDPSGKPIRDPKAVNPVDNLITRYSPESMTRKDVAETYDTPSRTRTVETPVGGMSGSRTPSLATLPRVTPPYALENDTGSPSINVLPTFRQPYHLRTDYQRDTQQSASIGTIPPSVAAALALSDLRPKSIQPRIRWEFGVSSRLLYPLSLTPKRVWAFTAGQELLALNKFNKKVEVSQIVADPIAASPGRAGTSLYVPLSSGFLIAIDGTTGESGGGANILWRTAVGGLNSRSPFLTDAMIYAAGDNSGVACLDRNTGDLRWRSEDTADQVIAANQEFLYIRNRHGKLLVYDAKRATDPIGKRSLPLAGIDLSDFNVPITNTTSDRVFLAADNGLIVCMRDQSASVPILLSMQALKILC
jgi:outer membrane protein assembly factor BamB